MAKFQLIIDADDEEDLVGGLARLAALLAGDEADAPASTEAPKARPRAGRKAAAAQGTTASGDQAASPDPSLGSASGQTATTAASPSDLLAAAPAANNGAPGKDAVMAVMQKSIEAIGAQESQAALEGAGLPKRISEIPAEKYGDAITALENAIALKG